MVMVPVGGAILILNSLWFCFLLKYLNTIFSRSLLNTLRKPLSWLSSLRWIVSVRMWIFK